MTHTPTPWQACGKWVCEETDPGHNVGICICENRETEAETLANAAFIVKAVNRDHHFDLMVNALAEIKKATIEGRVCDDVAWFDQIETLHDFCDRILGLVGIEK